MKKADKIKFELMRYCRSHAYDVIIPNFFFGRYEMDVFKLMQSGLVIEYEIKISRSDFFADFKKCRSVIDLGAPLETVSETYSRFRKRVKTTKHDEMISKNCSCNRFFFVVPAELIKPDEVPAHAGLLYFNGYSFDMIKNAPLIHKQKQDQSIYKKIALKLSFRSKIIEQKYRHEMRMSEEKKLKTIFSNAEAISHTEL